MAASYLSSHGGHGEKVDETWEDLLERLPGFCNGAATNMPIIRALTIPLLTQSASAKRKLALQGLLLLQRFPSQLAVLVSKMKPRSMKTRRSKLKNKMPSSKISKATVGAVVTNLSGLLASKGSMKTKASRKVRNPASIVAGRRRNWLEWPNLLPNLTLPSLSLAGVLSLANPPLDGEGLWDRGLKSSDGFQNTLHILRLATDIKPCLSRLWSP